MPSNTVCIHISRGRQREKKRVIERDRDRERKASLVSFSFTLTRLIFCGTRGFNINHVVLSLLRNQMFPQRVVFSFCLVMLADNPNTYFAHIYPVFDEVTLMNMLCT